MINLMLFNHRMMHPALFLLSLIMALPACRLPVNKTAAAAPEKPGLLFQNSLPKGGNYTSPAGETFGYGVFWTRIVNDTTVPVEIMLRFPADSFALATEAGAYFKIFLPPGTMHMDKEPAFNYGIKNIEYFLDTGLYEPTAKQAILAPGEAYIFYTGGIFHPPTGPVRNGISIQGQTLLYGVSVAPLTDTTFIPCGEVIYGK